MTSAEIINDLNNREIFFRIENNDDGFWITHIDRSMFPRIWMDNAVDGRVTIIVESDEHMLQRNSPLPEKDWKQRVFNADFYTALNEFYHLFNKKV